MDLNHLHLAIRNIDKSREFYAENFGFRHRTDHGHCVFMTNDDGFDLALDPECEPIALPKWFHFGSRMKTPAEVKSLYQKISTKSPDSIRKPLEVFDDFVFFRCVDPDGYEIEVYWE